MQEVSTIPTLEQSAQKVAAYLADTIPQAGDFVIEQAPDVVRELVALDLYRALGKASIYLVLFLVGMVFTRKLFAFGKKWGEDSEGASFIPFAAVIAACPILLGCSLSNAYAAIGPAFAPKAHLLERIGVLK